MKNTIPNSYLLAALSNDNGIDNKILYPKSFKEHSNWVKHRTRMGIHLIGGRSLFKLSSVLGNCPIIVITGKKKIRVPTHLQRSQCPIFLVSTVDEALKERNNIDNNKPLFILGGSTVFNKTINTVENLLLTKLKNNYKTTLTFPDITHYTYLGDVEDNNKYSLQRWKLN